MEVSFSHVALLVPSVDTSGEYLKTCGFQLGAPEIFGGEGTKELYAGSYATQKGLLLLLEAVAEGPYKRALAKRGPSLHHIAIDVLDVESFAKEAVTVGWKLHPASQDTMSHQTAWLYFEGIPTLIEIHQTKKITTKSAQVSRIGLPIAKQQASLFQAIGLGGIVELDNDFCFIVDGREMTFQQIAYPKLRMV